VTIPADAQEAVLDKQRTLKTGDTSLDTQAIVGVNYVES
jgi:hypothetical protein